MAARALIVVLLALAAGTVLAEQVTFEPCPEPENYEEDPSQAPPHSWNCTVNDVFITPCPEAANNLTCKIKQRKTASIQFDFTPEVAVDEVEGRAFWPADTGDLPLAGMNKKACQFTPCPFQPNHRQRYTYNLTISKTFPARNYDVKWRLYKEDVIDCCFIVKIKLVK